MRLLSMVWKYSLTCPVFIRFHRIGLLNQILISHLISITLHNDFYLFCNLLSIRNSNVRSMNSERQSVTKAIILHLLIWMGEKLQIISSSWLPRKLRICSVCTLVHNPEISYNIKCIFALKCNFIKPAPYRL